jgi:MATE family multidrug resistance protein
MISLYREGIFLLEKDKIRKVLRLAIPAVGEMLLYMLVWVVDTAFVGNYGGNIAVSSVGFASEIIYTIVNIFIPSGISIGITTMVAQSIGADDYDTAEKYLSHGLVIGTVIAAIITAILFTFPHQILKIAGSSGQVLYYGSIFIKIASIGAFFNMISSMLNSGLRGAGNTVIPLIVSVIVNIITISLDWILIFGRFGMRPLGIVGSAIATTAAYASGFIFLVFYYRHYSNFKIRLRYFKNISKAYTKNIIKVAFPSGLQEGAFDISRLMSLSLIMCLGTVAFAANQITTTIESISFMPGYGFAVAATALVGQRIGARDFKMAREYAYLSVIFGTGIMLLCSFLFITIPGPLIKLFIKEKETIELGKLCLMVASIEQPFMAVSMVFGGALKGAGDAKTPFIISLISSWIIRVPLIYCSVFILKLDVVYIWAITAIQWGFECVVLTHIFNRKSKEWYKKY